MQKSHTEPIFCFAWFLTIMERAAEATRSALPQSARLESLMVILVVLFVLFVHFLFLEILAARPET